jgi:hypothetical protein
MPQHPHVGEVEGLDQQRSRGRGVEDEPQPEALRLPCVDRAVLGTADEPQRRRPPAGLDLRLWRPVAERLTRVGTGQTGVARPESDTHLLGDQEQLSGAAERIRPGAGDDGGADTFDLAAGVADTGDDPTVRQRPRQPDREP